MKHLGALTSEELSQVAKRMGEWRIALAKNPPATKPWPKQPTTKETK